MLYMVCPSCWTLLGDKQLIYEKEINSLCEKHNVDPDSFSLGRYDASDEFTKDRLHILDKLCKRQCCRMRLLTYSDIVNIIIE